MGDLLSRAADLFPDLVFIREGGQSLTFGEAERAVRDRMPVATRVVAPRLEIPSIIEVMAAVRSGGAILVGPSRPESLTLWRLDSLRGDDARTVIFTSGSTGVAKAVRLTQENWEAAGTNSARFYGFGPGLTWLLALPLHHVGGLSIVFRALCSGGSVLVSPGLRLLRQVDFASLVPTQLSRAISEGGRKPQARAILIGGGPITPELASRAADWPVVRTYGMTETAAVAASALPANGLGPMRPLPGVEFGVTNDGRLKVRGAQVSPGYVGEPDRGPARWFVTSDRGTVESDGTVVIGGRADRVINTGGEKVDPEAIENLLLTLPGVDEVAVLGLPDAEWGEIVALAYSGDALPAEVEDAVRTSLGGPAVPRRLLRTDLPRTELGKVDYQALVVLLVEASVSPPSFSPRRGEDRQRRGGGNSGGRRF